VDLPKRHETSVLLNCLNQFEFSLAEYGDSTREEPGQNSIVAEYMEMHGIRCPKENRW
jgi:hypothetical protein